MVGTVKLPKVSALMAVHNGLGYLREAIESILRQTYADFEFILIDDASTDGSWRIMSEYAQSDSRVVLLRNPENRGLTASLNRGLGQIRGAYVARQDDDDVSFPSRFERQVSFLDKCQEVVLVGSSHVDIDEHGIKRGVKRRPVDDTDIRWHMLYRNGFTHASVMFRADVLHRCGLHYDEALARSQDYDLWSRLLQHGRGANIPEPLVMRRHHESQVGAQQKQSQRDSSVRTSQENLKRLGIKLRAQEVRLLRDWYVRLPSDLSADDMRLCRVYFHAIRLLAQQSNVDPRVVGRIRRQMIYRLLTAIPVGRFSDRNVQKNLWRSGLLREMMAADAMAVLAHLPLRFVRRIPASMKRALSGGACPG